jgi:hypothetical protein
VQLTAQLHEAKQEVLKLNRTVKVKSEENKVLFTDSRSNFEQSISNMNMVKGLEGDLKASGESVSADLYYHVIRLENENKDKDRVIKELTIENKTLNKLVKNVENEYIVLDNQVKETNSADVAYQQKLIVLENRIIELTNNLMQLNQENAMLLTIQKAKTDAIEELTKQLSVRGATDEYVEELKRELQHKEKNLADAQEDVRKLFRATQEREDEINALKSKNTGIPFQVWHEDRRLLQVTIFSRQNLHCVG